MECPEGLVPGDLVITEIMANPAGPDRGREWFEIHNTSGRTLDLQGFVLTQSREDGSNEKRHRLRGISIEPEQYLVLGGAPPRELLPHLDYGFGNGLGLLRNSGGRLALSCGARELSEVVYGAMGDGVAWGVDGSGPVHYVAASDYETWCAARSEYESGELGTPGRVNDACGGGERSGFCEDESGQRELRRPLPGQVVLTEVMPKSGAVPDASGEWFELHTMADVDLNGLALTVDGTRRYLFGSEDGSCLHHPAGTFLVLARNEEASSNGGLPLVDYVVSFFLPNSGERTIALTWGDEVIDTFSYEGRQVSGGLSIARDPASGEICRSSPDTTPQFGDGDYGTPGAKNPSCPEQPSHVEEGQCEDEKGARPIRPPEPGDLRITEFMPRSGAVADADGEWIELKAFADVELNGLEIGMDGGSNWLTLSSPTCLTAEAGSFVLLARNEDPEANGGLPSVDHVFSFFLPNTGERTISVRFGEVVLDSVSYEGRHVRSGTSSVRDPVADALCLTPQQDAYRFGAGDHGTPGRDNPACVDDTGVPSQEGKCVEQGVQRDIEPPGPGALAIREIHANTGSPLLDRHGEWFELEVLADVDLNGLEVSHDGQVRLVLTASECLRHPEGSRVLFARSREEELNGGLPYVDFTFAFNLVNRASSLSLGVAGETIDFVAYPNPPSGRSAIVDSVTGEVCQSPRQAELEYSPNNFGSPGAEPPSCP